MFLCIIITLLLSNVLTFNLIAESPMDLAKKHNIVYTKMPKSWDEGLPLGNGSMGALVWGDGSPLIVSIDRIDLWDLRPVPEFEKEEYNFETMRKWEKEGRYDDLIALYEKPYDNPGPTKIPAGRIKINLPQDKNVERMELHLDRAMVSVDVKGGGQLEVYVFSDYPIGFIRVIDVGDVGVELIAPPFGKPKDDKKLSNDDLRMLEYPSPQMVKEEDVQSYLQEGWGGFKFAVYMGRLRLSDNEQLIAWSIIPSSNEMADPLSIAEEYVKGVLNKDYTNYIQSHVQWWERYWKQTYVSIPDEIIEKRWYHETYKFGSAGGVYPIALQGPWTADNGKRPPWKGDYHHDLNTEMSYWIAYSGNRLEQERHFIEWLWNIRGECFKWTQRFFNKPGLNVAMTTDIIGRQIGGWRQYTHSATTGAWLAHHFYWHWKYTNDKNFLEQRAYPYLHDCAVFIDAITKDCRSADGKRKLPLSSSPEINDNRPNAWFDELTNYDLSLIRWLFTATAELSGIIGKTEEQKQWLSVAEEFPQLWVSGKEGLLVAKDYPLSHSHRHFSHLMSIFPLGMLNPYNVEDMKLINTSLDYLDTLGTSEWCGYSFAWKGILSARAGRTEDAIRSIKIFSEGFVLPNSFHCNGDQSGKGYSNFTYRPFTLEGNFASGTAVQEMLLQSHNGLIRVFPCIPDNWKNVSFHQLRAEGGFLVSAEKKEGKTIRIIIQSDIGTQCTLLSPFTNEKMDLKFNPGETKIITE
ncbi:MAG TPA: glycoside hydrolase N-terminal domain-containing protein [Candidatus Hydrogenedens sp.]|nr:glycoside hydrolase N-terminal domain-containing protein [Candidatus Hydrogenedens sp.]HOL20625.1 glycoside hydrolase N-terminal domain-containing protein [Candidatus Hydrogenedens sp.]HPP59921.1 glycoside hydrolase N-terminal domain-containing protein [Candidatus Hydrogenedens sp.]